MTQPPPSDEPAEPSKDEYPVDKLEREALGLPPLSDDDHKRVEPPQLVRLAVALWLVAALVLTVGFALMVGNTDAIADAQVEAWEEAVRADDPQTDRKITPEQIRSGAPGLVWLLAIGGVMLALLLAVFAYRAREGTRSARSVLAALTALVAVFVLFMPTEYVNFAHWVALVLAVAALVGLFLPQANEYFPKLPVTRKRWRDYT